LKGGDYSSEGVLVGTIEDIKKSIKKKFNKNLKLSSNTEFGILVFQDELSPIEIAGIVFNLKDLNVHTSKVEHGLAEIEYLIDSTFAIDSYNKLKV
jgi:hypothetical protein